MPSLGEAPSGEARALWLLSRFSKVTRRKGGTLSGRYRSNGYTHEYTSLAQPTGVGVNNRIGFPPAQANRSSIINE